VDVEVGEKYGGRSEGLQVGCLSTSPRLGKVRSSSLSLHPKLRHPTAALSPPSTGTIRSLYPNSDIRKAIHVYISSTGESCLRIAIHI
jgi:hypothetical protein